MTKKQRLERGVLNESLPPRRYEPHVALVRAAMEMGITVPGISFTYKREQPNAS